MGILWSNPNRRRNNFTQTPPPPPPHYYPSDPNIYPSYPPNLPQYPSPYAPPPPPPGAMYSHYYASNPYAGCNSSSNHYSSQFVNRSSNYVGGGGVAVAGPVAVPYFGNNWASVRPPMIMGAAAPLQHPGFVEHPNAKKVRNDVNVHKDTLRIEVDPNSPDHHLVSFTFDAQSDGSITILYFAKEEPNCRFIPLFPEACMPIRIPFQKGPGQKFQQPSGTGIDLGFFELDDLSIPSPGEDVFPLVISAETESSSDQTDEHLGAPVPNMSNNLQITQAVLVKNEGAPFQVKVIRQLLWFDGVRYELREIYGIGSSAAEGSGDDDSGKECVICMTDPKDTAVLPCRHLCMCSECARALTLQSNKCPICRQPIEELMEIKIVNSDH